MAERRVGQLLFMPGDVERHESLMPLPASLGFIPHTVKGCKVFSRASVKNNSVKIVCVEVLNITVSEKCPNQQYGNMEKQVISNIKNN